MPSRLNVLFLTKYDQSGASSRYRTYQYLPFLNCINCTVSPLLRKQYLEKSYANEHVFNASEIVKSFFRRLNSLFYASNYDLLIIEYEIFPYFPPVFEKWLTWKNIPYIVDYDDALFHQYDHHKNFLVRYMLKNKISKVMKFSSQVIVGNSYLANYAKKSGAQKIITIPTVVNLKNYALSQSYCKKKKFTIVWIGSPSTSPYLLEVLPALQALKQRHDYCLRLIGAGKIDLPEIDVEWLSWQQDKEVEYLSQCHVGIMPLPDTPWTRGKCGFKLIQYMACRLPVVASPVGINQRIVKGNNGYLASEPEEWLVAFEQLIKNPIKGVLKGEQGRLYVEQLYSLQATKRQFKESILKYESKPLH